MFRAQRWANASEIWLTDSNVKTCAVFLCPPAVLKWNSFFSTRFDSIAFAESQSEDEQFENDLETDPPNWQQLVSREVLLGLKPCEIKRQEVINGEFN